MNLNWIKQSSFVVVPSIYLFYLSQKHTVHAKDEDLDKNRKFNQNLEGKYLKRIDDLKNSKSHPTPNLTYLRSSKKASTGLIEAFRYVCFFFVKLLYFQIIKLIVI